MDQRSAEMARYFFHVENGQSKLDDEGLELPDPHAARVEAVRKLGDILRADPHHFWDHQSFKLTVTDENHLVLFVLDLSGVVAPAMSVANRA